MRTKWVLTVSALATVLAIFSGCSSLQSHEPRYDGKRLSVWMAKLCKQTNKGASDEQGWAREATWTNVVQAVGTNGLPYYLKWMVDLDDPVRRYFAAHAVEILGPAAEPAIPALATLLKDNQASSAAANCLLTTGPAAIPVLTEAVETLTNRGQVKAIEILGEFGPLAKPAEPILVQIIKSNSPLAWPAMQTLVEIETNSAVVLPLLALHVSDTNSAVGAAYALGRLGDAGIPMLLLMLTNDTRIMRCSAAGALDPVFQKIFNDRTVSDVSGFRFRRMCSAFNLKVIGAAHHASLEGDFVAATQVASHYTNSPDVNIREAANNALNILRPLAETNMPLMKRMQGGGFKYEPE